MSLPTQSTALLVIRVWIEEGSPAPLRAEVRLTADVSAGFERTLTLTRNEAVVDTVQDWLATVSSDAALGATPD